MPLAPYSSRSHEDEPSDGDASKVIAGQECNGREISLKDQRQRDGIRGEERAQGRGDDGEDR